MEDVNEALRINNECIAAIEDSTAMLNEIVRMFADMKHDIVDLLNDGE